MLYIWGINSLSRGMGTVQGGKPPHKRPSENTVISICTRGHSKSFCSCLDSLSKFQSTIISLYVVFTTMRIKSMKDFNNMQTDYILLCKHWRLCHQTHLSCLTTKYKPTPPRTIHYRGQSQHSQYTISEEGAPADYSVITNKYTPTYRLLLTIILHPFIQHSPPSG